MSPPNRLSPPSRTNGFETCKTGGDILATSADLERSRPPTPHGEGLPINFAEVVPGVYRSSFPLQPHLKALEKLDLKTIITLVDEEYPPEYLEFVEENEIVHHKIHIVANKDPTVYASEETILRVLRIVLDKSNHPLLIHCNKGKHRTGCIVACFRKVQGWSLTAAITEYLKYSEPKSRTLDRNFITAFDETTLTDLAKSVGACSWAPKILPLSDGNKLGENATPGEGEFDASLNPLHRSFTL
ncbi:hypothetical protein FQN54_009614 [Arachnomyces sp. PD_36]|nr:hypothetical protein FQN54_009614 [Arachnomyces sp. PD_36]